jgi:hypothetical protein
MCIEDEIMWTITTGCFSHYSSIKHPKSPTPSSVLRTNNLKYKSGPETILIKHKIIGIYLAEL